jgi:hypothetical protein
LIGPPRIGTMQDNGLRDGRAAMIPTLRILVRMGALQRLAPLWAGALVAALLWPSPWLAVAVAWGALLQMLVEYGMHRFLFHREPPAAQGAFNDLYRAHIGHHEHPDDPELFTGGDPWFAVRFALASWALHTAVLWPVAGLHGAMVWAGAVVFLGSATAFAFYEYCHTLAHLRVPKGRFGRAVTRSHMRHHFNDHETTFHVSAGMGWIDRLFGTAYDRDAARDRYDPATILSLGMDPDDLRLVTARKAWGKGRPRRRDQTIRGEASPSPSTAQ